jgi:hypothetical protein
MTMADYLTEIEHAARSTIDLVWAEHAEVEPLDTEVARLTALMNERYDRAGILMGSDDPDEFMMGVGEHWSTYFEEDKDRFHAAARRDALAAKLEARQFSRAAMSASLIDWARHGIATVHGKLENAPAGRDIHGIPLSTLIWMARNQGLHWEEGQFRNPVTDCFERLQGASPDFAEYKTRNMAFDIVRLLGWRDYAAFEADMNSLA